MIFSVGENINWSDIESQLTDLESEYKKSNDSE
jgi:hypothetical protein